MRFSSCSSLGNFLFVELPRCCLLQNVTILLKCLQKICVQSLCKSLLYRSF